MISFELKCGRRVFVEEFFFERTYSGVFFGKPTAEKNSERLARAVERAKHRHDWEVYLVPPVEDKSEPEHPRLPSMQCTANLVCMDPISPEFMSSGIVVMWHCGEFENLSLRDIIERGVQDVPWNDVAKDFDW